MDQTLCSAHRVTLGYWTKVKRQSGEKKTYSAYGNFPTVETEKETEA